MTPGLGDHGPSQNSALCGNRGGVRGESVVGHRLVGRQPPLITVQHTALMDLQGLWGDGGNQTPGVLETLYQAPSGTKGQGWCSWEEKICACAQVSVCISVCMRVRQRGSFLRAHPETLPAIWHCLKWLFPELSVHSVT